MSRIRKIGLILSATGIGLGLSHSLLLRLGLKSEHPLIPWILFVVGVIGLGFYRQGLHREGRLAIDILEDKAIFPNWWYKGMLVTMFVTGFLLPPLPTKSLYEKAAADPCGECEYWVMMYRFPGASLREYISDCGHKRFGPSDTPARQLN